MGMAFLKRLPKSKDIAIFELKMFPGSVITELYDKERPIALSTDEYTYWALIQHLLLFSDSSAEKAVLLHRQSPADLKACHELFRKEIIGSLANQKIVTATILEKGQKLTSSHIRLIQSKEFGIDGVSFYNVIGMRTKANIPKGNLLQWEHLYHSYDGIRGRKCTSKDSYGVESG
jgi:hypothetical protein